MKEKKLKPVLAYVYMAVIIVIAFALFMMNAPSG